MKMFFVVLFSAVLFSSHYSYANNCSTTEETGNSISEALMLALNTEHTGDEVVLTSFQKATVGEVTELKFDQCNFSLWVNFDLTRQYMGDTSGKLNITGTIYEVDSTHICLKEIAVPGLELEGGSEIEIAIYRTMAELSIAKDYCFNW